MTAIPSIKTALFPIAICMFFASMQPFAYSQTIDENPSLPVEILQNRLDQLTVEFNIPGIIVGIEKDGERWIGSSGFANIETQEPLTADHQFRLASITKTFTAALILKLSELGELSLDDTLEQWLPGVIPNGENMTITMLLNHTSGLFDYQNIDELNIRLVEEPNHLWTEEEIIQLINQNPVDFEPGAGYSYSNSGYYLLGMIAEKATGDTVENLTRQYIFDPAGVNRTRITRSGALEAPFMPGYTRSDIYEEIINVGDLSFTWDWTAGSGVSTASDMLTWVRALFSGKIINEDSLQKMTTPIPPCIDYGFGMDILHTETGMKMTHNGYNPGTLTEWSYYPDTGGIMIYGVNYSEERSEYIYDYFFSVIAAINDIYNTVFPSPSGILNYELYQ